MFIDAARLGCLYTCNNFLNQGANVDARNKNLKTPLILAASRGVTSVCDFLISHGAKTSAKDSNGDSPLAIAARNGHFDVCALLLNHGVEVNLIDDLGETELFGSVESHSPEICRLLLEHGVSIDHQNNYEQTALMVSIRSNNVDVFRILLEYNANTLIKDCTGLTPLHYAGFNGKAFVFLELLKLGIDPWGHELLKSKNIYPNLHPACAEVLRPWLALRAARSVLDEPARCGNESKTEI